MRSHRIGLGGVLIALAVRASGQQIPFQLLVTTPGQSAVSIQNGGALTFLAALGQSQTAQIEATYSGGGQVTISQPPTVFGSLAFKATIADNVPLKLTPGGSVSIIIQFSPTTASLSTAQISLPFTETLSTGSTSSGSISLALQGTISAFALSYVLQTDQNVVPLQSGGAIPFPATLVGTTAEAALNLTNTGSGPGTVTGIKISGSAFRLQGIPLLPAAIASSQNLQVLVLYKPTAVSSDTGQITITFATGSPITINLTGSGSSSSFTYQVLGSGPPATVSAGGAISLPGATLGQSSSVTIRVLNSGNASGSVSSISLAGQGFQLSNVPVLPQTLASNASLTFTVNFTPTQPGAVTGTLIVNSDSFKLNGTGLGPLLAFSYVAGGSTITLSGTNNSVVFSPAMISQSEQLTFGVMNSGTLPATISNIGVGQAGGPYSLSGLPALPVTLAPNASFQIVIKFTPAILGFSNGSLQLDATTIALIGSGTQPPPLPAYTLTGPSGTVTPMTQPVVSLSLASAYPVEISGTLTMTIAGTLPADPAIQFATGGRTVAFVIPANQTSAVFGAQGTQIGLQTGTVAGNVTLTPSFATQAGNVDLTPSAPQLLQFNVAPAPPTMIAIQVTGVSATAFTIQATGFATTRTLTSMSVQFTTEPGFSMPTAQFTLDLTQVSVLWFQSTASQAFGGQFSVTIPFTFQGAVAAGQSVTNAIASVSVTMSNALGASNSIQATLP